MLSLPSHGGDIGWASATFGIPIDDWLDLSTGISPWSWPVAHWPQQVFRDLPPQSLMALQQAAADYYQCPYEAVLPVPGSQYAINLIPALLSATPKAGIVAIAQVGYHEHASAWQRAGYQVRYYRNFDQLRCWVDAGLVDHVVLINPNNPSAECITKNDVRDLQQALMTMTQQQGLLIVDEAFMDTDPQHSLAGVALTNTIVLRSFGKFFGLAGVRLGFLVDHSQQWLARLKDHAGPWLISHPAVWVAQQALQDNAWVVQQRCRIATASRQLTYLLQAHFHDQPWAGECHSGGLFVTTRGAAQPLYQQFVQLAEQGVLVRYGQIDAQNGWLRTGLSPDFTRLQTALKNIASK